MWWKRLLADQKAQAMTEAALVMPIVVMIFLGAHEFMYMNEYKHRSIWASRFVIWEAAVHDNHPEHDQGGGEVTRARMVEFMGWGANGAGNDAYKLFFEGRLGVVKESSSIFGPQEGEFGFSNSFTFGEIDPNGSTASKAGNGPSGGGINLGSLAGNLVTGGQIMGIPFGPDLPERGFVFGGYTTGWKPLFLALLWPQKIGEGAGTTRTGFYSSPQARTHYTEFTEQSSGTSGVTKIGHEAGKYGRYAILAHDWRALNDDGRCLQYHVSGFTLLGGLTTALTNKLSANGSKSSTFGDIVNGIIPFKCCVLEDVVGSWKTDARTTGNVLKKSKD